MYIYFEDRAGSFQIHFIEIKASIECFKDHNTHIGANIGPTWRP